MDLFELNRKIDRLLFDALPSKPEPSYERNVNDHVTKRVTLQSLGQNYGSFLNKSNSKVVGHYKFDSVSKKFVYKKMEK